MTNVLPQRDARQRDIVPPDRLAACQAMVVGVGAIGRQVALQLAAIGVPDLRLVDPDHVEVVNLACQGYLDEDLGQAKVHATAELCRQMNPQIQVRTEVARFRSSTDVGNCLFCCVDDIEVRQRIWQAAQARLQFFSDGRMSAEVVRVLSAADEASRKHYPTTLFTSAEAYQGACTAKSTIFTANIAAGLMLSQFSKWLRRLPIEPDLTLNLLSAELSIG
jgi:sulfur carrier protein ThiS adenylyltransferase